MFLLKKYKLKLLIYFILVVFITNISFFFIFNYLNIKKHNITSFDKAYCFLYFKHFKEYDFLDLYNCKIDDYVIYNNDIFFKKERSNNENSEKIISGDLTESKSEIDKNFADNWSGPHKNYLSNKFYVNNSLNNRNIKNLKVKWKYNLKGQWSNIEDVISKVYAKIYYAYSGSNPYTLTNNVHGASPSYYNGKIFLHDFLGNLISINAETGKLIWKQKLPIPIARRGILIDKKNNFIYSPSGKGIYKINLFNGKILDIFTNTKDQNYSVSNNKYGTKAIEGNNVFLVPPIIHNNKLIAVNMDSEVISFSINSKKIDWKTSLRKDFANGANPWSAISFDSKREHVYIVTGNPGKGSGSIIGLDRKGNNLYSNSVVSINVNNGKINWFFQDVSHDLWDLDMAFPPILSKIEIKNKKIDILTVVGKSGNVYVINRETGKNIFDYKLIKVENSKITGEDVSNFQKETMYPPPLINMEIKKENLSIFEKDIANYVLDKFKMGESGKFKPPNIGVKTFSVGISGGGQWYGGAIDNSGILYVPINNIPWVSEIRKVKKQDKIYLKGTNKYFYDQYNNFATKPPWGFLYAIDLKSGKIKWSSPYGKTKVNLSKDNQIMVKGSPIWGGIMVVSSEIIIASGSFDSKVYFYDTKNGNELHSIQLDAPGSSPPIIYEYNNQTFISLVAVGAAQTINSGNYIYGIGF